MESRKRSLVKSATYRSIVTVITGLVIWLATGNIYAGFGFAGLIEGLHSFVYYFHERIWQKLKWGYK